ncbi:MAG: glycoside hydrolase family 5 protein [Tepidisphaeraceae bacterium]
MKWIRPAVVGALMLCSACWGATRELSPLHVRDGRIVEADGRAVTLRGVNLGNWLLIEPGGLGGILGDFPDQAGLFHILRDRFGEAERRRLIDVYRDHYITERDFDNVAKFGFNFVRIGFDHELLEDEANPWVLRADAFKYLDYAVREAKARGLYVLFDLHGAPGRQVSGKQSGDSSRADFWTVPDNRERALWLWAKVAEHFRGEPTVFAYESLNEPFSGNEAQNLDFAKRFYDRIRPIDAQKILILPGLYSGVGFYGDPRTLGWENVMFDLHFYPGVQFSPKAKPSTVQSASRTLRDQWPKLAAYLRQINTPLLVGELSVVYKSGGGGEMIRRYTDAAADYGWAVSIWTLKELSRDGGVKPAMWMLTTNRDPEPVVDVHTAGKGEIEAALDRLGTMPLVVDPDALHWLTSPTRPKPLPSTWPVIGPTTGPATAPATRPATP